MKKHILQTAIILLLMLNVNITSQVKAQSALFQEDFEASSVTSIVNENTGILPDGPSPCGGASRGNTVDFNSTNVDFNSDENSTYFLGLNPESPCGGYYKATLISDVLDLTGVDSLYFKCRYLIGSALNWGSTGITVEFDNGSSTFALDTIFSTTDNWTQIEVELPEAMISSTVSMKIFILGGDGVGLDEIVIQDGKTVSCQETTSTINPTACDSYVSPSGKYTWTSSDVYMDTVFNVAGCDSLITVNLTINSSNTGTDNVTACESYTWIDGNTYTSSNDTATITLTNQAGCDSLVTINLTILDPSDEACASVISGIGDESTTSVSVYPNPVENWYSVDLGKEYDNVVIEIRAISGQLITSKVYPKASHIESSIEAPVGTYIISIKGDNLAPFTKKIIKKQK